MVNGLPGNMAAAVAGHALDDNRFELVPYSLTGPEITAAEHLIQDRAIRLIRPEDARTGLADAQHRFAPFISVDFTHPTAVTDNARTYCRQGLPFVMGTTGGDRNLLDRLVCESEIAAVIAPNMAKQIVGFQAMMEWAGRNLPGLFSGYQIAIRESHQQGKADTSGTAKAMVDSFNRLGTPCTAADIARERDPRVQKTDWGIPEAHLAGHAWHTYTLTSADQTVKFEFSHNVNGRDIYALGTLDAARFLARKVAAGRKARVYSMIDVLKEG